MALTSLSTEPQSTASPLRALESAYRHVIGDGFGEAIRSLVEGADWYSERMSDADVFDFWVRDNIESCAYGDWLFLPVRPSERKLLSDYLGIDRVQIVGKGGGEHAQIVLSAVGLPALQPQPPAAMSREFFAINEFVSRGEDERAASLARQRAERLLRTIAYFYCHVADVAPLLEGILADPGNLRLPRRLLDVRKSADLATAIAEDGWADLGFLSLFVRKLSAVAERQAVTHIRGTPLLLMENGEYETFVQLAKALQPYTHDRSLSPVARREALSTAIERTCTYVDLAWKRGVVPEEMLVLECCTGVFGPTMSGRLGDGTEVAVRTSFFPPVGSRVLLVRAARRRYARCDWALVPWDR